MRSNRILSLVAFACLSFDSLANASPGDLINSEPSADYQLTATNDIAITNTADNFLANVRLDAGIVTLVSKDAGPGSTSINKAELIACLTGQPTGNVVCPNALADVLLDFSDDSPGISVTEYLTAATAQHQYQHRGRRPDTGCERAPRFPHDAAWLAPSAGDVGLRS